MPGLFLVHTLMQDHSQHHSCGAGKYRQVGHHTLALDAPHSSRAAHPVRNSSGEQAQHWGTRRADGREEAVAQQRGGGTHSHKSKTETRTIKGFFRKLWGGQGEEGLSKEPAAFSGRSG